MRKQIIVAMSGGILMGLTTAPFNAWYLAWIAFVPLWMFIFHEERFKFKWLVSFAWGCGYYGIALFWITGVHPMTWMGVPWVASLLIAIFCWVFITLWGAALVVAWSGSIVFFKSLAQRRRVPKKVKKDGIKLREIRFQVFWLTKVFSRILIGVTLWCALEAIWSTGPLWWSSLSYTQSPDNLAILQLSQLSGPSTVTATIVAVNGLIAESISLLCFNQDDRLNFSEFIKHPSFILLNCAAFILIGSHLLGFWLYSRPVTLSEQTRIKIGIIQGNVPNEIKLYPQGWRKAIEGYTIGYKTLAAQGVDLVLTPETALPFSWHDIVNNNKYNSLYQTVLKQKVPILVGAFGQEKYGFTNSLFTLLGTGKVLSQYNKVKLVPLGEYIPFEQLLGGFIDRLSPLDAHLIAGKPNQILVTSFGPAIVGICYESAFAEHFRRQALQGGEFIITASNNAHYSHAMPAQHHAQDIMRAIETDRWTARATNTGYSAIINPRGKTQWISGINTYELHGGTIHRRTTKTLYVRWGDWLTILLLLLAGSSFFWDT